MTNDLNQILFLDWDTEGYTSGYSTGGGGYDRIKPVWSQPDITPVAWGHQVNYTNITYECNKIG